MTTRRVGWIATGLTCLQLIAAPLLAAAPSDPRGQATGEALVRQAQEALTARDLDTARGLALEATRRPGAHRDVARILYADVLYVGGEVGRARDLYLALHARLAGDQRAVVARKVVACNRALHLPELDGLAQPASAPQPSIAVASNGSPEKRKPREAAPAQALYAAAYDKFLDGEFASVLQLAPRAVLAAHARGDAKLQLAGQLLYGDALLRSGEARRAKAVFVALAARTSEDLTGRIAACDRALATP